MQITITECDHPSVEIEKNLIEEAGYRFTIGTGADPASVIKNSEDAAGILVQYGQITAEVLDALPSLKVVSRYGVGVDTVDIEAATARGIAVCNVPDYGTESVSDHAIGLTFALLRGIPLLDRKIRGGTYDFAAAVPVYQSAGRRFGVIGLGAIGEVTARKAHGVGFDVVVSDPRHEIGSVTPQGYRVVSTEELLATSQVVSLHTPLIEATKHLINADSLATMRPDALVINTARGGVVDTDALVEALRAGTIAGAGLDCTEVEPLPADHPLCQMDNVILSPHSAFYSEESFGELKRRTAQNAIDVVAGKHPRNILNPQVLG